MSLNGTMLAHCCVVFTFVAVDFSRLVATDSLAFFLFHPILSLGFTNGQRGKGANRESGGKRRKVGER